MVNPAPGTADRIEMAIMQDNGQSQFNAMITRDYIHSIKKKKSNPNPWAPLDFRKIVFR